MSRPRTLPPLIETAIHGWTLRVLAGAAVFLVLLLVGATSVHRGVHRNAEVLARAVMDSIDSGTTVRDVDEDTIVAIRAAGPAAHRVCDGVGAFGGAVECVFELAGGGRARVLVDGERSRLVAIHVEP